MVELVAASGCDASGGPGGPAASPEHRVESDRLVRLLAGMLGRLHRTAPAPGSSADDVPVLTPSEVARRAVERVRVDPPVVSAPYRHLSPERLGQVLAERVGLVEGHHAVLTHGGATAHTLVVHRGEATGLVDWSRAAVADPHRDLAHSARWITAALGAGLVPALFDAYDGGPVDPVRLDWWVLAAELLPPDGGSGA